MNITSQKSTKLSLFNPEIHDLKTSFLTIDTTRRTLAREYTPKKILLLGLSDTGKSSIALKFLYGFPDASNHGPEENHYTSIKYKNEDFLLHIVDIADLDEYTPLYASKYSAKVDGYIFVYAVDNQRSFEFIRALHTKLYDLNQREVPAVLVANKSDIKSFRVVSTEEGKKLAKLLGMPYLEVSAKKHSSEVIKKIFEIALKEIIKNEDATKNLKLLKNWEEERVELLFDVFNLASFLASIMGLFFVTFAIIMLAAYSALMGAVLILILINGFLSITLAGIGFFGMQKDEKDWLIISEILIIISVIFDITTLILKGLKPFQQHTDDHRNTPGPSQSFGDLYLIVSIIMIAHIFVLVLLFLLSCLSKEISIKRRNAPTNRFASLKV